jgi:hypothetical protein
VLACPTVAAKVPPGRSTRHTSASAGSSGSSCS